MEHENFPSSLLHDEIFDGSVGNIISSGAVAKVSAAFNVKAYTTEAWKAWGHWLTHDQPRQSGSYTGNALPEALRDVAAFELSVYEAPGEFTSRQHNQR